MGPSRLAFIPAAVLVVTACSTGSTTAPSASSAAPATRVAVILTDALKMQPVAMTVPAGVPVTFIVTNSGVTDYEFYLGDEEAQVEHAKEMGAMGGMTHDEPEGIGLKPGETKELTHTFAAAGTALAGCHVVGHYGAGMKADITIVG